MNASESSGSGTRICLAVGLVFMVAAMVLLFLATQQGAVGAIAFTVLGVACLFVAGLFWAGPIAAVLSRPMGNLFFPNEQYDRPQPLYSLAEAQARRREYEEAMATYADIAANFPQEARPWIGMIEIAVEGLGDLERANALFAQGVEALTSAEAKETLATMYRGIRSTRAEKKTWEQARTISLPGHDPDERKLSG